MSYQNETHIQILERENSELQAKLAAAEDALEALYDYQNGCPLPTYRTGWTAAMVAAENVLRDADRRKEVAG